MLFFVPMTPRYARTCSRSAGALCLSALISAGLSAPNAFAGPGSGADLIPAGSRGLSITKRIDGIPGGSALDDALFWIEVDCGEGGKGDVRVADLSVNAPTQLFKLPPSATCTLTELANPQIDPAYVFPAAPAGYAWQPAIAPPVTVVLDADGSAAAVIVNTLQTTGSAEPAMLPTLSNTILLLLTGILGALGMRQMRRGAKR